MKSNFFMTLICICFLAISGLSAQSVFSFRFQVYINGVDYGDYETNTTIYATLHKVNSSQPSIPDLCPGDEITLRNKCVYNSSNHDFNGSSTFGRPTIGLTATVGCSNPPSNIISILHLGDVCTSCNYVPPAPTYQTFNNWNFNNTVTVTYHYTASTYNYLAITAGAASNEIGNCGCGHRIAYLPLNFGNKPTQLASSGICPSDVVNLNLDPNCSYSNWIPSNPNGNTLSTTTNYTVDITNTTSGCTINDDFTISVQHPDVNLSIPSQLCYKESIQITENDFWDLASSNTSPSQILVNGVLIADGNATMNLPHVIDATNYGAGIVTIEYIYNKGGVICSQIHEVIIRPEIALNLQSSYAFCSGNFQTICATTSGIAQAGITYIWTKSGIPFAVGSGVCFTPSSYGSYTLRAYDHFNCEVRRPFTVYDSGVGIRHPKNITFCSMTQRPPSYIGWHSNPFGSFPYNFNWTYTNLNGTTVSFANTGAQYQVPYLGPGTYTTVVNANGCTETISIIVTDLLQVYNNHSNANFNFTPLSGNQVSCQPLVSSISGVNDIWTVINLSTNTPVSTFSYGTGIRFAYSTGVQYAVTLRREFPRECQIFINQFAWLDGFNKNKNNKRDNLSNNNTTLSFEPTTVRTFPNPTTGLVNIQLKDAETAETNIKVLNTLGQVILEKQVQNNNNNIEVDLSREISGLYILHIVNGTSQFTEKVIKQ